MSGEVRIWFDPSGRPLAEQEEWPVLSWAGYSMTFTLERLSTEALSIMLGIPLVDASIMWEPHLVRGTQ